MGKVAGALRLIREASRWRSFRSFCASAADPRARLQRLDYLPSDYVTLLGASAKITESTPAALSGREWQTDRVSGHRYPDLPSFLIRLRYGRGHDPKVVWESSSFGWAVRASARSPDSSESFSAWIDLLSEWSRSNPPGVGINWLSPMECAHRAANIVLTASSWWQHIVGEEGLDSWLATLLARHAEFVARNPEIKPGGMTTNHTTANYCGLLTAALAVRGHPLSGRWAEQAATGLESCIARQVRRDGMAFESSIPYSFYVLDAFAHGALLMRKAGIPPSSRYLELLRGLFRLVFDTTDSRGNLPSIGDDDSGVWVTPRTPYMPAMLSSVFSSIFGVHPGARAPATARSESGIATLRRGDIEAVMAACPVGQEGLGGHNHEDLLQLCFSFMGVPVVIDPGSGSYSRDLGKRSLLRSMESHNGPVPDGAGHYYTFPKGAPFDLLSAEKIQTTLEARDKGGRTGAVAKAEVGGRTLVRKVILTEDSLEAADFMLTGAGRASGFSTRLLLNPRWEVVRRSPNLLTLSFEDAELEFESSVPVETSKGLFAPRYDAEEEATVLSMHADSADGIMFRFGSEPARSRDG